MVYGQHEVVKDLVAARLASAARRSCFEVSDVTVDGLTTANPVIRFRHEGEAKEIECDFIAGCDGFHGICRPSIPDGVLTTFERTYPFGWLGILAQARPASEELIYASHERGFALALDAIGRSRAALSPVRSRGRPRRSGRTRASGTNSTSASPAARALPEGPVLQKGVTAMRSFVVEPMQYGRLFLAGDAAHIVPPTGAKGMNLAFADVQVLARGVARILSSSKVTRC